MHNMAAIVLAAGKGVRMQSDMPKVLHEVAGRSMLQRACDAAQNVVDGELCIVVGHGAEQVRSAMGDAYRYALQEQQLGTGHAVQTALASFSALPGAFLVLCGDTPLLRKETLESLRDHFYSSGAACTVLTAVLPDAGSYGRILRDENNNVKAIVEAKDATPEEYAVREINSGIYCFDAAWLAKTIAELKPNNAQGEFYLTDTLAAIRDGGGVVNAIICEDANELMGVNDRVQLAEATALCRRRKNEALMRAGVTICDPASTYIDDDVTIGRDTVIEPQTYLCGKTIIGAHCSIGPAVKMIDTVVADHCTVGPFTYLRPGTVLQEKAKAGSFVEMKKAVVGKGSKVPHLSYIGDAEIGERVNIGCGTITCNYDGKHKYKTEIEDDVFVGSNTNFIAPVHIGARATIAAGSTITQNVPEENLGVARGKQANIEGWAKRRDPRFRED